MTFDKRIWTNLGKTTVFTLGMLGVVRGLMTAGYALTANDDWHNLITVTGAMSILGYFYALGNMGNGVLNNGASLYDRTAHYVSMFSGMRKRRYRKLQNMRIHAAQQRQSAILEQQYVERLAAAHQANTAAALSETGATRLIQYIRTAYPFCVMQDPDECYGRAAVGCLFVDLENEMVSMVDVVANRAIRVAVPAYQSQSVRAAIIQRQMSQTNLANRMAHIAGNCPQSVEYSLGDLMSMVVGERGPAPVVPGRQKTR